MGIGCLVPNGEIPPTVYPECRCAPSGEHGVTLFAPIARASSFVDTWRSPCIRTINGFFRSSSITSVFTTPCSSTPSSRADTAVPPFSS